MKTFDLTEQWKKAHDHYDEILRKKMDTIAELAGVDRAQLIPINPCDFVERCDMLRIDANCYNKIDNFITANKKDNTFLVSPIDEDQETANQISYKSGRTEERIRASKCKVVPIPRTVAVAFCVKNHRQSVPHLSVNSVNLALVYKGQIKSIMSYDFSAGAIRGHWAADRYELLRLAIAHGTQVNGGASRLQKHAEEACAGLGVTKIFSYSNATINNGNVYKALGFQGSKVTPGAAFVVKKDLELVRLASLITLKQTKNYELYSRGRFKVHLGGNRVWTKDISLTEQPNKKQDQ